MEDGPEIEPLNELLPIDGVIAQVRYQIQTLEEGFIGHGFIVRTTDDNEVPASFLLCKDVVDAKIVHHNLSEFKGESFLRSHFVIERKSSFWVAVEKVDHSLNEHRNSNYPFLNPFSENPVQEIPLSEIRLNPKYQVIIRDIMKGMCQLHEQYYYAHGQYYCYTHGMLPTKYIMLIKDRAKFAFIRNNSTLEDDYTSLKKIFKDVLLERQNDSTIFNNALGARVNDHVELKHFLLRADVRIEMNMRKLYFHPLLMSCGERFLLPLRTETRLRYRMYHITVYAQKYNSRFTDSGWKVGVRARDRYNKVLERGENEGHYPDTAWGQFKFVRNATVHVNDDFPPEPMSKACALTAKPNHLESQVLEDLCSLSDVTKTLQSILRKRAKFHSRSFLSNS